MADALAKVSDGLTKMKAKREADEADELAALLLILAEV